MFQFSHYLVSSFTSSHMGSDCIVASAWLQLVWPRALWRDGKPPEARDPPLWACLPRPRHPHPLHHRHLHPPRSHDATEAPGVLRLKRRNPTTNCRPVPLQPPPPPARTRMDYLSLSHLLLVTRDQHDTWIPSSVKEFEGIFSIGS